MESNYYDGSEKRNYIRIVYKPNQRPILKVKQHEFGLRLRTFIPTSVISKQRRYGN
jgi:hypothetical protein